MIEGLGWMEIGSFVDEVVSSNPDGGASLDGDMVVFSAIALGDELSC